MSPRQSPVEPQPVDATRSRMMASVRTANTDPELVVRRALFKQGFRYRLNVRKLPGAPDILLPRFRSAILVHGCFWHRHTGCRYFRLPKTRKEFWEAKLEGNAARDARNVEALMAQGWRVAVVWECATRHAQDRVAAELRAFLRSDDPYTEIRN